MFSDLDPNFLYTDISPNVMPHDDDVLADEWTIDGRNVYRGARDPQYTHANVYWLYDDSLHRVGCSEHDLDDPARFKTLWFRDNDFGTLFQEDWQLEGDIWSRLPPRVFEKCLAEGWTTPASFLEHCLSSSLRILTADMLLNPPKVYECAQCKKRSLQAFACGKERSLDFTDKVWFIDDDMLVFVPPQGSKALRWVGGAGSSEHSAQELAQGQEAQRESQPSALPSPHRDPNPPPEQQAP
jgi:hypothetical protein